MSIHTLQELETTYADGSQLTFASRILLLISLYIAKFSVLAILQRIFVRDQPGLWLLCNVAYGFTIISALATVFVGTVGCPSSGFFVEHCSAQVCDADRWLICKTDCKLDHEMEHYYRLGRRNRGHDATPSAIHGIPPPNASTEQAPHHRGLLLQTQVRVAFPCLIHSIY